MAPSTHQKWLYGGQGPWETELVERPPLFPRQESQNLQGDIFSIPLLTFLPFFLAVSSSGLCCHRIVSSS